MYRLVESNDIIFLLSWFQNLFTAPSFGYFCCFIQSLMGLEKEGFVTNVYLSSNSKTHWTNFHRFLSRYQWSTVEVSRRLLWLLLKVLKLANECERLELIGALDDTPIEKHGPKFFGVGWHHKPHNNKKEKRIWANCWVCFGLLFQFGTSWLFFPISALLYVRKKYIKVTSEFKTKLELGKQIIENLELPDWIHLTLITDGFYGPKKNFTLKLLEKGIDALSRLRIDAAIYEPPPQKKTKKRGRPRKYGDRLYIKQLAAGANFFTPTEITIYGKKKIVDLGSKLVKIRGWDKLVLLVITRDVNNKPIALFSTNILLSPARVLQLYSARWKIELAFRELKQLGKMADYRVRSKEGMTKHVTLCFVAHSLLKLIPLTKIQMHTQPVYRPWYKKAGISTGQLRIMFQRECLLQLFFRLLQQLGITHENDVVINEFNNLINRANEIKFERTITENEEFFNCFIRFLP
jgi:hypothetical protein